MKRFSSSIKFRQEPYFKALLRESSYVCPILIHALLNPCYAQVTILAVVLQESLERVTEEHVFKLDTYDVIFSCWTKSAAALGTTFGLLLLLLHLKEVIN